MALSVMRSPMATVGKSVGFDMPSIIVQNFSNGDKASNDSDSDDDDMGAGSTQKLLDKAFSMTMKSRFKGLVGDALQLTQQNRRASQDFMSGLLGKKVRRISMIKGVVNKKIPKLSTLVITKDTKPYFRFKRMARVVLLLIQVCNICKDTVTQGVKKEPWFALLDNLIATDNMKQKRKGPRAFVTFVPNENRELVQLTFDVGEFKKDRRTEFILTDEVREILSYLPKSRPEEHIAKVIRCMKAMFEDFNNYSLSVQKQICQKAFYDKYRYNRVIVKKGQNPDGIYFVLSGSLIEKHEAGRQPKEIQTGAIFGENDLICGSNRRHTVMTRTETEILYLHRQDYRAIFNMSEDSNDPRNLEICKQHIVFKHFPMFRLVDNPGTWSVLKYKYGRLIAKDSNNVDWIYVIKSGEARVFKYLQPGQIDIQARRKKVQAVINSQSAFYKKKKILNFVEERDYIKSSYSPRKYHPTTRPIMSAPAGKSREQFQVPTTSRRDVATCIPGKRQNRDSVVSLGTNNANGSKSSSILSRRSSSNREHGRLSRQRSTVDAAVNKYEENGDAIKLPALVLPDDLNADDNCDEQNNNDDDENSESKDEVNTDTDNGLVVNETIEDLKPSNPGRRKSAVGVDKRRSNGQNDSSRQNKTALLPVKGGRGRSGSFVIRTPTQATAPSLSQTSLQQAQTIQVGNHRLPAFVQVETLHPGQVFGLRACLDPEERGPNVSLVSGECEILQINKKFFMKHCDDAIYSLIRLKAKPFPSQEDLIDRLDVNMQWEEYKQKTMVEFLQQHRRLER